MVSKPGEGPVKRAAEALLKPCRLQKEKPPDGSEVATREGGAALQRACPQNKQPVVTVSISVLNSLPLPLGKAS